MRSAILRKGSGNNGHRDSAAGFHSGTHTQPGLKSPSIDSSSLQRGDLRRGRLRGLHGGWPTVTPVVGQLGGCWKGRICKLSNVRMWGRRLGGLFFQRLVWMSLNKKKDRNYLPCLFALGASRFGSLVCRYILATAWGQYVYKGLTAAARYLWLKKQIPCFVFLFYSCINPAQSKHGRLFKQCRTRAWAIRALI